MAGNDVIIRFLGETSEFNAKLAETQGKLGAFSQKAEAAGGGFAALGVIAIAAVGAIGVAAITLADKFDVVHARLETVTKAVGQDFSQVSGAVKQADDKMAGLGFTAIDSEQALGTLIGATHNVGKATRELATAADLARFKHIGLADAATTLVRIQAGQYRVLKSLGISTEGLTKDTKGHEEALRRLSEVIKGQAIAYTHTLAGEFDILKARVTNAGIAIGERLIPLINGLIDGIGKGIGALSSFNESTGGWAGKLGAVAISLPLVISGVSRLIGIAGSALQSIGRMVSSLYLWAAVNPALASGIILAAGASIAFLSVMHELNSQQEQVKKTAKDLTDAVVNQGDTLGQAAGSQIADYVSKHEDARKILDAEKISTQELANAVQGDKRAYEDITNRVKDYANAHDAGILSAKSQDSAEGKLLHTVDNLRQAFPKAKASVVAHNQATKDLKNTNLDATAAIDGLNNSTQAQKVSVDQVVQALQDGKIGWANYSDATKVAAATGADEQTQLDGIAKALDAIDTAHASVIKSTLGLDEALHTISKDEKDANDAFIKAAQAKFKDKDANDALQVANDRLLGSIAEIATKGADVADQYDKLRISQGSQITAEQQAIDKHYAEVLALSALNKEHPELQAKIKATADQLGLANITTDQAIQKMLDQGFTVDQLKQKFPDLSAHIDDYVKNHLNTIPPNKNTTVTADTSQATNALNQLHWLIATTILPALGGNYQPPKTALGGIFTKPQVRLIGEAGPEAVIPLNNPRRAAEILNRIGAPSGAPASLLSAGGTSGTVINLTVNALDPRAAEDGVIKALQGWARRNGPVPVKVAG